MKRPELIWPGKYDADGRRVEVPRQSVSLVVDEQHPGTGTGRAAAPNHLLLADNLRALDALLERHAGQVDLCYIDPPFGTGSQFPVATRVGDARDGEPIPELRAPAYSDAWQGGLTEFLAMLDPRLRRIHELLAPHGSLYVHVDPTVGHAVKLLCDDVFGPECFQREIVWRIGWVSGFKTRTRNWIRNHDLIFFYVKDPRRFTFNKPLVPYPPGYRRRDGSLPRGRGIPIDDVWNAGESELALSGGESLDSIQIKSFSTEKSGYATQKNESLLRRIIAASSNPGDLVVDVFCGSGTTLVAAQRLGRRFVGCDSSFAAVHIARKRLLGLDDRAPLHVGGVAPAEEGGTTALPEPRVDIELRGVEERAVTVCIEGYRYGRSRKVPAQAREAVRKWSDWIDYVAVDWNRGETFEAGAASFRTHADRTIDLELGPHRYRARRPVTLAVRIVDILGLQTEHRFEITPG